MAHKDKIEQFIKSYALIAQSDSFLQVLETIRQVAETNITVLITGESGTGKEMIAKAIHQTSHRSAFPMISVNCGAIPEGILESELFGHEKGAFTGASETRKGYFEIADSGTLFLDEIGEMPLGTQVKLLRVLEEKEFLRVGGSKIIKVDVRMIAATNKRLEDAVNKGEFRKDLFYRLNAVKIHIPPLRERKEDIRPLAMHFAAEICKENGIDFKGISEEAFTILETYSWPGNIRELRNIIERAVILGKGNLIDEDAIRSYLGQDISPGRNLPVIAHKAQDQAERELIYRALLELRLAVQEIHNLLLSRIEENDIKHGIDPSFQAEVSTDLSPSLQDGLTLKEIEKSTIGQMLKKYNGNRKKASKSLGIGERTLYRKIKEYGIEDEL